MLFWYLSTGFLVLSWRSFQTAAILEWGIRKGLQTAPLNRFFFQPDGLQSISEMWELCNPFPWLSGSSGPSVCVPVPQCWIRAPSYTSNLTWDMGDRRAGTMCSPSSTEGISSEPLGKWEGSFADSQESESLFTAPACGWEWLISLQGWGMRHRLRSWGRWESQQQPSVQKGLSFVFINVQTSLLTASFYYVKWHLFIFICIYSALMSGCHRDKPGTFGA